MENKDGKKDMINEYKQERTNLNEEINRKNTRKDEWKRRKD